MLTHLKYRIKEFAPFVLPQKKWIHHSGKTNGVLTGRYMSLALHLNLLFEVSLIK